MGHFVVSHTVRPCQWGGDYSPYKKFHYSAVFHDRDDAEKELQNVLDFVNDDRGEEDHYKSAEDYNANSEFGFLTLVKADDPDIANPRGQEGRLPQKGI